jgi:hypothetical protein
MGKLLCDASSTAVAPAADPLPPTAPPSPSSTHLLTWPSPSTWSAVWSLDDQQRRRLLQIHDRGVAWKPPSSSAADPVVLRLDHGGEVDSDGNCLFTAARRAAAAKATPRELRHRAVRRFRGVYAAAEPEERATVDAAVRHLYAPDLGAGWGVHVVQEVKLLAAKDHREGIDAAIKELVDIGIQRFRICPPTLSLSLSLARIDCLRIQTRVHGAAFESLSGIRPSVLQQYLVLFNFPISCAH